MAGTAGLDNEAVATTHGAALKPWLLPGWIIVGLYWAYQVGLRLVEAPISTKFFAMVGAALAFPLAFTIWWFSNRRVPLRDRLFVFGAMLALAVAAGLTIDPSIGVFGLVLIGPGIVFSAWLVWLTLAQRASRRTQLAGCVVVLALTWGAFLAARMDGITGAQAATLHWRWTPTAESVFLAERAKAAPHADIAAGPIEPVVFSPGDWGEFRGPHRFGEVAGVSIAPDFNSAPPKRLWQKRVGPAWSSVLVIGNRLYTQEQRGDTEAVVCLAADTGDEIWSHGNNVRFWDGQAGAGPRATPTFHEGRLYALGGTGVLDCLDAGTGRVIWSRDIRKDSGAPAQMWGYSNSPLVVDGKIVVWAGGADGKGLLAYNADNGEIAWQAATGVVSYSSSQLATLAGVPQVLILTEQGVAALEPATGKPLWTYAAPTQVWRAIQPRPIGDKQVLVGSEDMGMVLLDVSRDGDEWKLAPRWKSNALRPAYNDLVICDQMVIGLVDGICTCVDLETGKRLWRKGRYGHGQLLLLADQKLVLVLSETGDVALVRPTPQQFEELGRFSAIEGKTWNHPVIAHGRLFIRNDEQMACFELTSATK